MITITGFDILRVFPGAQNVVIDKPLFCCHCDGDSIGEYDRLYATASTKDVVTLLAKSRARLSGVNGQTAAVIGCVPTAAAKRR